MPEPNKIGGAPDAGKKPLFNARGRQVPERHRQQYENRMQQRQQQPKRPTEGWA